MKVRFILLLGLSLLLLLAISFPALAGYPLVPIHTSSQTSSNYNLDWWTVDGGGGTSSAGGYTLSGTIGQYDASGPSASSSGYQLTSGFWFLRWLDFRNLFLPLVIK